MSPVTTRASACSLTDSRNRRRAIVVRKFRWMSVAQASFMLFRAFKSTVCATGLPFNFTCFFAAGRCPASFGPSHAIPLHADQQKRPGENRGFDGHEPSEGAKLLPFGASIRLGTPMETISAKTIAGTRRMGALGPRHGPQGGEGG